MYKRQVYDGEYNLSGTADVHPRLGRNVYVATTSTLVKASLEAVSYTHLDVYKRQILYYLFKNAGKICSRNDIVDFLWDNQLYVDDNALSVNITRIRDKLATIGLVDFIKTKHRQGYTL